MSTDYKTLTDRLHWHYAESKRIWDAAYDDGQRAMTSEEKKAWNFHESENRVLYYRIQKEFPDEVARAKADLKAIEAADRKFLAEWNPDYSNVVKHKDPENLRKKLLDEIRALEDKDHEDES